MLPLILLLNVAASSVASSTDVPLVTSGTSKSMHEFGQCFMASQKRLGRPLWVVPNEGGGARIGNDGARGVTNPYRIRFKEGGPQNVIEVFIARRDPTEEQTVIEAVAHCR